MSKKNKFYWFEGVTEKGVNALLSDENPKFRWLRTQRNRRALVALMAVGLVLTTLGSYWPAMKSNFSSNGVTLGGYSILAISLIFVVLGGYSLLRISVRSIADAPDELLDERQVVVRNTSYRFAYYVMGYLFLGLLLLMFFGPQLQMFQSEGNDGSFLLIAALITYSSMPSMVMAWRERDI
jgi:polyferredoxin